MTGNLPGPGTGRSVPVRNGPGVRRAILEREHELAVLAGAARDAAGGVALVFGEAGIGKSSLVEAVRTQLPAEGRMLVGL